MKFPTFIQTQVLIIGGGVTGTALSGTAAPAIRTLLYTQLLGLALGLPAKSLGL